MKKEIDTDRILSLAKKQYLINILGGCCQQCGEKRIQCLTFHHIDMSEKEIEISEYRSSRISKLLKEIYKCKILCANCHQKIHKLNTNHSNTRNKNKQIIIEYMNSDSCGCCNNKLDVENYHCHHLYDKKYIISRRITNLKLNNSLDIPQDLCEELDKCILLCPNCHLDIHFDKEFYDKHYQTIIDKSKNIKELHEKFDVDFIVSEYRNGKTQKEISKSLNAAKSTICGILKSAGELDGREYKKIIPLFESSGDIKYICEELKLKRKFVLDYLNRHNIFWKNDKNKRSYVSKFDITVCELSHLLKLYNFTQIGKMYNVTYVAVRQKAKKFGLIS